MGYISTTVIVIIVLFFLTGFRIVRPTQRAAVETFGKYRRFATPGLRYVIPIVQRMLRVNITEKMQDVQPQDIITKDNLNAKVDLVVYYKIKPTEDNMKKSLYNVDNVDEQIISLAQTTARNVIGDMVFREVNSERNKLNKQLAELLDKQTDAWGVQIVRVELMEITPPRDVQETMNQVIKAENEKEAAIDFATAKETEADGIKRANIKEAEGIAQGKIIVAKGEAQRIQLVNQAANKYFVGNAQKLKKLDVTQASLEKNSKIILSEKGISPTLLIGKLPLEK